MNPFDIIVYVALAWALVSGWWRGLAVQLLSLAGVVAALFVAAAAAASANCSVWMTPWPA